ncbi:MULTISPECIES: hypothetical protein [Deinococcus]|uniref:DUF927 domain-containing protein n=1 Tax=Deinococcus rufus TaxID=2136097 RepID=A0ABV7ZAT8_9DEIO|nr:hypothetical protein [Deinococcus sp. AB2017081]WQE94675.1 hypothetical protein U2P90_14865 [Deinococcus sp. AB2017081]
MKPAAGTASFAKALDIAKRTVSMPEMLRELCPAANFNGLYEDGTRGGNMYDPRPGLEEATPSFTVRQLKDGTWVYNRHDGETKGGTCVDLLMLCKGLTLRDAITELIDRAGLPTDNQPTSLKRPRNPSRTAMGLLGAQLYRTSAIDVTTLPDGWKLITADTPADAPECQELKSRGLLGEASSGSLKAYQFTGRRPINHAILPGAVAFVVNGVDGQPVALKVRNPGTKEELSKAKKDRYRYASKGSGAPAHYCPAPEPTGDEIWLEGELNAVAVANALRVAGIKGVAVQGIAGVRNKPWLSPSLRGHRVYISGDADTAGEEGRVRWAAMAQDAGAIVHQLRIPEMTAADACDLLASLGAPSLGALLQAAIVAAEPDVVDNDAAVSKRPSNYGLHNGVLCRYTTNRAGEEIIEPLASFSARIVTDAARVTGNATEHHYTIVGADASGDPLRPIVVSAADYDAMTWMAKWGSRAYVVAGRGVRDHLRVAIMQQSNAAGIAREVIYTQTGWVDGMFLHAGEAGAITSGESFQGARVELLGNLTSFNLPAQPDPHTARSAIRASLALLELAPDRVAVPMLAATYRAPLGRARYVVWVAGQTGSGKTTLAVLCQAHYGAEWRDDHLPATFTSTGFSITLSAFSAADVLFVIDDYKPAGSGLAMAKAQGEVGRIIAAVGEGGGRMRGATDGSVRGGEYPRGVVMITGELSVARLSDVARTVTVEIDEPLITPRTSAAYREAQRLAANGLYAAAMSAYIAWIARHKEALYGRAYIRDIRDPLRWLFEASRAHNRTPDNIADLAGAWRVYLTFACEAGAVSATEAQAYWRRVVAALREMSTDQATHLSESDPVRSTLRIIQTLLLTQRIYLADADTGQAPTDPGKYGWQPSADGSDSQPNPRASLAGYVEVIDGVEWLMFLPAALYTEIERYTAGEDVALPPARTLWRRIKEALRPLGYLISEGDRTTHRRSVFGSADGARVELLHLRADYGDYLQATGTKKDYGEESVSGCGLTFVPITFSSLGQRGMSVTQFREAAVETVSEPVPVEHAAVPVTDDEEVPGTAMMTVTL